MAYIMHVINKRKNNNIIEMLDGKFSVKYKYIIYINIAHLLRKTWSSYSLNPVRLIDFNRYLLLEPYSTKTHSYNDEVFNCSSN